MAGEKGMQYNKKKFTVAPEKFDACKKCFKDNCLNEGETCKNCRMINGIYIFYQPHTI